METEERLCKALVGLRFRSNRRPSEATWERPSRSARDARAPDTGEEHHDAVSSPTSLSMWSFRNLEL